MHKLLPVMGTPEEGRENRKHTPDQEGIDERPNIWMSPV